MKYKVGIKYESRVLIGIMRIRMKLVIFVINTALRITFSLLNTCPDFVVKL